MGCELLHKKCGVPSPSVIVSYPTGQIDGNSIACLCHTTKADHRRIGVDSSRSLIVDNTPCCWYLSDFLHRRNYLVNFAFRAHPKKTREMTQSQKQPHALTPNLMLQAAPRLVILNTKFLLFVGRPHPHSNDGCAPNQRSYQLGHPGD